MNWVTTTGRRSRRPGGLGGAPLASIDPTTVTGLMGWYDAFEVEAADGDPVSVPNSHTDGTLADLGGSDLPAYREAPAGFNGAPALDFDGTERLFADVHPPEPTKGHVLAVVRPRTLPGAVYATYQNSSIRLSLQILSGGALEINANGYDNFGTPIERWGRTADGVVSVGGTYLLEFLSNGTSWGFWVNDTNEPVASAATSQNSPGNDGSWIREASLNRIDNMDQEIGGRPNFFDGLIGVELVYDHNLTSAERDDIVGQLNDRYNIF